MNPQVPVIGFGLDAKYAARYPSGMEALCRRYNQRLTHLSVVGLQSQQQALAFKRDCAQGLPVVHHLSNVAPADPDGPNLERMRVLDGVTRALDAVWSCEDIGIWSIGPYAIPYFAPPLFEEDVADIIAEGIRAVQATSSVEFLAEIPSCSFVAGRLSLGEFFERLVARSDCKLLLDVSHVYSYGLVRGLPPLEILESLPLERVLEVHVAGGRVNKNHPHRYIDSHSQPILDEVEELLGEALVRCKNLRCVTYELGVGLSEELIESEVTRLETALGRVAWAPQISAVAA